MISDFFICSGSVAKSVNKTRDAQTRAHDKLDLPCQAITQEGGEKIGKTND